MRRTKYYRYYPTVGMDHCKVVNDTNKTLSRLGVAIGALGIGGVLLYKKVDELVKEVKKLRETEK